MKKILLFLLIIFLSLYFILKEKGGDINAEEKNLLIKPENKNLNEAEIKSVNDIGFSSSSSSAFKDHKDELAKYSNGIKIMSLNESDLSNTNRELLKQKFDNLHKYGNFNKNKIGNEFKNIKKYKNNIDKDYPLSFVATENEFLENNFDLTGKYASGAYSRGTGFNSYTRLFENKATLQKIELTEMYLNPKTYSLIEVYKESFNRNINGLDLTFQEIPVGDTKVFTVDFATNQKKYSLSTIRLEKKDVENLVFSLIQESNNFRK